MSPEWCQKRLEETRSMNVRFIPLKKFIPESEINQCQIPEVGML